MRISDWSSDVCSSDLKEAFAHDRHVHHVERRLDRALGELLLDRLQRRARTRDAARALKRRAGDDVAELRARTLEADGADVGDIVGRGRKVGLGGVEAGERGNGKRQRLNSSQEWDTSMPS